MDEKAQYFMGVADNSYTLIRKIGGNAEFLLVKTMDNEAEFTQEVENLAKYFDAKVFKETNI